MNTKMKAFAAVFLMVALSFAVAIPAVASDDQSNGDSWTDGNTTTYTFVNSYGFVAMPIVTMPSDIGEIRGVYTVASNFESDAPTITYSSAGVDVGGVTYYYTGTTMNATVTSDGTITVTAHYLKVVGEEKTLVNTGVMTHIYKFVEVDTSGFFNTDASFTTSVGVLFQKSIAPAAEPEVGAVTYSATGLPEGITMLKNGTFYGAAVPTGDYTVKVTAYQAATKIGEDKNITISVKSNEGVTFSDVVGTVSGYITNLGDANQYYYVYSNGSVVFNLKSDYTTGTGGNVEFQSPYASIVTETTNTITIGNFGTGIKGEVNFVLKVTTTNDAELEIVSYIPVTIYVIPSEDFLTEPVADGSITYA